MHPFNGRPKTHEFLLVFMFILLFTTSLVNLNGGDWDGTQIALGSFFFEAAQADHIVLYSLEWQPLTYAIIHWTYRITGNPEIAMFLPALFGALGIAILLITMSRLGRGCLSTMTLVGIILLLPEFLFESVYMNSTVFGFPFAALAMWLACPDWMLPSESKHGVVRNFLVGLSLAMATLCRFDFLLAYPMFLYLLARSRSGNLWRHVTALGLGSAVAFLPALAMGMTGPHALIERIAKHQTGLSAFGQFHRTASEKLAFGLVGVNGIVWVIAAGAAVLVLVRLVRKRRWFDLLVIGPTAVLLYPLLSLGTPKYLVPFYLFLAAFLAWSLSRTTPTRVMNHPASIWVLGMAVMLACFLPGRPTIRPPFIHLTMNAALATDDGPRAFWGYAHALRHQSKLHEPPDWLRILLADPKDLLLISPYDGWLAGSLSQRVLMHLARNCKGISIGPGTFAGQYAGKKIVIADPNCIQESVEKHFTAEKRIPVRVAMPHGFTPQQVQVLGLLVNGEMTEAQLKKRVHMNADALRIALSRLRQAKLLEATGPNSYRLKYRIEALVADPNRTSSDD